MKKKSKYFFYNNLSVQGIIAYFYNSSKWVSLDYGLLGLVKIACCCYRLKKDTCLAWDRMGVFRLI